MSENSPSEKSRRFADPSIQISDSQPVKADDITVAGPAPETDKSSGPAFVSVLGSNTDLIATQVVAPTQAREQIPNNRLNLPRLAPGLLISCLYLLISIVDWGCPGYRMGSREYAQTVDLLLNGLITCSLLWYVQCLFKMRAALKQDSPKTNLQKPTKLLVIGLMFGACYGSLRTIINQPDFGDTPDYLNWALPFINIYCLVVLCTWHSKLGRIFDARSKTRPRSSVDWSTWLQLFKQSKVKKSKPISDNEKPRVGKYAVVFPLLVLLTAFQTNIAPLVVCMFVAYLNWLFIKVTDKSYLAQLAPISDLEGKDRVVLRYRVFAALERWLKQRFSGGRKKQSQLGPAIALGLTLLPLVWLFSWADSSTISAISDFFVKFNTSTATAVLGTNVGSTGDKSSFYWLLGAFGIGIIVAVYGWLKQPTNLELSGLGIRLFTKLGKLDWSDGISLKWCDISRVELHQPSSKTNVSDCELVFVTQGRSLRLKLGSLESVAEKELILKAIEKWAPSVHRSAEVIQALQAPSNHSYTELWLQALAGPPKREKLKPLVEGAIIRDGLYTVIRPIGIGGQGFAYLSKNNLTGESVVLKEFLLPVFVDMSVRKKALVKFENEAKILKQLDHPQIVRLLDFLVEDHRAYLVLEHIDGLSMRKIVQQQGKLAESQVRDLAKQMCKIQRYLHSLTPPVVHRDFTPDNLILRKDGTLKVIDFNVAQQIESTATGSVVGKHAYLPPEQFRGQPVPQSDIYALGATLSFLLTGEDPEPISESHPRQSCPSVSLQMDALVAKATSTELAQRYLSVDQLAADLDYVVTDAPTNGDFATEPHFVSQVKAADEVTVKPALHEADSPVPKVTLKVSDDTALLQSSQLFSRKDEEASFNLQSAPANQVPDSSDKREHERSESVRMKTAGRVVETVLWALALLYTAWPLMPEKTHRFFEPTWYASHHAYKASRMYWAYHDGDDYLPIIAECNKAIAENPNCYEAYLLRSNVYEHNHDFKSALADALKCSALRPNEASININLSRLYDKLNMPKKVISVCDQVLGSQDAPAPNTSHMMLADDMLFHSALKTNLYQRRGWNETKLGLIKSAIKDLSWADYVLDANHFELGLAYGIDGHPDQSLEILKRYVLYSDFSERFRDGHHTVRQLKQYVESLTLARQLDKTTFVCLGRALGFRWIDQPQKAVSELDKAIATTPDFADLYVWRGSQYWHDNAPAALDQYNKAIKLDPKNVLALYYRALLFNEQKNYKAAKSDCDKLLQLNGEFHNDALALRAESYMGLHRYADASEDCWIILGNKPAWVDVHVLLADAYEAQGLTKKALDQLVLARKNYIEGTCKTDLPIINARIDSLSKQSPP